MPLNINGNEWNLLYLDTNALSEMISNNNNFGKNILLEFAMKNYCFCFSFYNVLELKNGYPKRYNKFIEIFSKMPCIMFMPYKVIVKEEVNAHNGNSFDITKVSYSFVPMLGENYDINHYLSKLVPLAQSILKDEENAFKELAKFFTKQKDSKNKFVEYDKDYEIETTKDFLKSLDYKIIGIIDINKLPACRMINMSVYNRIVNGKKIAIQGSDINDIMISAVTPYVDSIITEKYQKSIIDKAKNNINQIKNIDCYKVSDFYDKII